MSRGSRVRSPPGVEASFDSARWGISSIGRVRALQARGTGIETPMLQAPLYIFFTVRFLICCSLGARDASREIVLHKWSLVCVFAFACARDRAHQNSPAWRHQRGPLV